MKKIITNLWLAAIAATAFGLMAHAGEPTLSRDIERAALSATAKITGGTLSVDYNAKLVTLVAYRSSNCPKGAMCLMMIPTPIVIKLPLDSISVDEHGIRQIVAKRDARLVDGNLEVLTIRDTAGSDQEILSLNPTVISYTSTTAGMDGAVKTYETHFRASRLSSLEEQMEPVLNEMTDASFLANVRKQISEGTAGIGKVHAQ